MFEEITKSFKAILYDRVISPLSGTFIFSWLVINWKIPAFLFLGNSPVVDRVDNIGCLYVGYEALLPLLIYPLLSAAFLIFAYPFPAKWVYKYSKKHKEDLVRIKQEIESKTLLTQEKSDEIRLQMAESKNMYEKLLGGKEEDIAALNRKIQSLERETQPEKKSRADQIIRNMKNVSTPSVLNKADKQEMKWKDEYKRLLANNKLQELGDVILKIANRDSFHLSQTNKAQFLALGIIQSIGESSDFNLTDKGRFFAYLHHTKKESV